MKLLKIAALSAVAYSASGCALFNAVKSGDPNAIANAGAAAKAEAEALEKKKQAAVAYAEDQCKDVLKTEVSFNEERAIGGVVGIELVSSAGHLFLDGATEKNPAKLNEQLAAGKAVTLPDSAINDLTTYVSIVGKNLARLSARPDLPWTFAVIKNDSPNAFSAPGGYVVVTTGLLQKMQNEAQLAGVLGHEIGHVVHKHSLKKYKDAKHKQCIAANFGAYAIQNGLPRTPVTDEAALYAKKFDGKMDLDKEEGGFIKFIMSAVIGLLQGGNDRESELETDRTALELVAFAGYDPTEYEKFLVSLGNQGGFLSSHPSTDDRVANLSKHRENEIKPFAIGTAKPDITKVLGPVTAKK